MSFRFRSLTLGLSLALLAGCGGGDASSTSPAGEKPAKPAEAKANKPAAQAPGGAAQAPKNGAAPAAKGPTDKEQNTAEVQAALAAANKTLAENRVPTQDEADAAAAAQITDANADAEYEKLLKEIEGDDKP